MSNLTEEKLKSSEIYKDWIAGEVALIHNTYFDSKDQSYSAFIVVSDENDYMYKNIKWQDTSRPEFQQMQEQIEGKWTITRFFEMGGKIQVSVDYQDISTKEVFKLLLSEYSRGLA